ncbi:MAG: sodium:phosphate symporter, partial [Gemmatimonadetes bacterium]|nr:sodium:phosphate symporter [Gemmatimonadota bacterium]
GVLVPLFNRRGVTRDEVTPYVLGANVTTLLDTFVVAVALQSWDAAGAVLALMVVALTLSVVFM